MNKKKAVFATYLNNYKTGEIDAQEFVDSVDAVLEYYGFNFGEENTRRMKALDDATFRVFDAYSKYWNGPLDKIEQMIDAIYRPFADELAERVTEMIEGF